MPAASGFGSKRNRLRDRVAYVRTDCNFTPDMTVIWIKNIWTAYWHTDQNFLIKATDDLINDFFKY